MKKIFPTIGISLLFFCGVAYVVDLATSQSFESDESGKTFIKRSINPIILHVSKLYLTEEKILFELQSMRSLDTGNQQYNVLTNLLKSRQDLLKHFPSVTRDLSKMDDDEVKCYHYLSIQRELILKNIESRMLQLSNNAHYQSPECLRFIKRAKEQFRNEKLDEIWTDSYAGLIDGLYEWMADAEDHIKILRSKNDQDSNYADLLAHMLEDRNTFSDLLNKMIEKDKEHHESISDLAFYYEEELLKLIIHLIDLEVSWNAMVLRLCLDIKTQESDINMVLSMDYIILPEILRSVRYNNIYDIGSLIKRFVQCEASCQEFVKNSLFQQKDEKAFSRFCGNLLTIKTIVRQLNYAESIGGLAVLGANDRQEYLRIKKLHYRRLFDNVTIISEHESIQKKYPAFVIFLNEFKEQLKEKANLEI